jgi:hypothetical protein
MDYFFKPNTSGRNSYRVTCPLVAFSISMHLSAGALSFLSHLKTAGGLTSQNFARLDIPPVNSAALEIADMFSLFMPYINLGLNTNASVILTLGYFFKRHIDLKCIYG